ncbi:SAM-dependent methyltransferase [Cohnella endophytica]|uniref:SAM-dependent methyltransferase n=1 Tax=Cohnella endophytica TaxID=2419778 RepID=A0A494Y2H3_9BACL|nr:class I SAM-dependent methyltransferase [Cohnella endophytica]RKP56946.1 SAM-dependent methyltransferase [Cohnella endophytica]
MIVTTTERPQESTVEKAVQLAAELQSVYVPRGNKTIRALRVLRNIDEVLIVGPADIRLVQEGQHLFYYHPSMALVRLKRLRDGGNDTLLTVTGASPGNTILDCTAGLCSDSLVFSYAVGREGKVIALEASRVVHAIVREGLLTYETGLADIDAAMRAIQTASGRYQERLPELEDKSADIVYFDPMFEKPVTTSSSLIPLRSQAFREPLDELSVRHAIRVARKKVVLKDHRDSGQFERLGFSPARMSGSAVAYGVINIE